LARDSGLIAQGGAVFGARTVFLERCVVDGGARNGVEGRMDGEVLLLDSFVRADVAALSNVSAGVLVGAILSAGGEAAQNLGRGLVICPLHVIHAGPSGALPDARRAPACLIGR
jgi:hypothetical protein